MGALQINLKILVRGVLNEKTVLTFSGAMVFCNTGVSEDSKTEDWWEELRRDIGVRIKED